MRTPATAPTGPGFPCCPGSRKSGQKVQLNHKDRTVFRCYRKIWGRSPGRNVKADDPELGQVRNERDENLRLEVDPMERRPEGAGVAPYPREGRALAGR